MYTMYTMETSHPGRLGLQQVFPSNFQWKGKTFSEITSLITYNTNKDTNDYPVSVFLKAQPIKGFRKEIASVDPSVRGTSRLSQTVQNFETPGGAIVSDSCKGVQSTKDFNYKNIREDNVECSACDIVLDPTLDSQGNVMPRDSTFLRSLNEQDNARRRVRSGGMNRTKFLANKNNSKNFFSSSSQYLHSRNKTFKQNQFNSLRIEGASPEENTYASNTVQSCGKDDQGNTSYVPVYYKPNNNKFAQQGGVSASTRLVRLKYDTITDVGSSFAKDYGKHTANALAYGVPANGYTVKDKIGYPNKCTPFPNGKTKRC